MLEQVANFIVKFVLTILLARILSIEAFSLYTLIWSFIIIVLSVNSSLLLNPMIQLHCSGISYKNFFNHCFTFQIIIGFIFLVISSFILALLYIFIENDTFTSILCIIMYAFSVLIQEFFRKYFVITKRIKNIVFLYIGQLLFYTIIYTYASKYTIETFFLAYMLFNLIYFIRYLNWVNLRKDPVLLNIRSQLLEIGNWLSISTIASWLAGQFFLLASISQLGITSSAYINIARNITSPVIIIFTALESILLLKCKGLSFSEIPKKILTVSLIWFVPVLLYVMLTLIFGESLVYLLFGNNYIESEALLIWFSVCHIIIYFIRPLYIYLRLAGKTKLILYPILVSCLFSLLCSYHFTTWFGIVGAMLVMCSKEFIILLLTLIIVFKINKFSLNSHI